MEGSEDCIYSQKEEIFEKLTVELVKCRPKGKDSSLTCNRFLSHFLMFAML